MAVPTALITLLVGVVLTLSGLWVGHNVKLLPIDASSNAPVYDALFEVLFSIGTILFLGIVGLLVYSLVRFRRRPGETGDGQAIEGNLPLEIVWTAIPAVVVLFVGLYSYDIYEQMGGMASFHDHSAMTAMAEQVAYLPDSEPSDAGDQPRIWGGIGQSGADNPVLPVDVTAMQFAFIFHYPGVDITSGELHIPLGQSVQLRMEAKDVIHAFWVPQFRLKQDVIPGQPTLLTFTPTRAGTYPVVCAELCGPYHGGMRTNVVVHEPEAYEAWLKANQPATVAAAAGLPTG
ncbi:MAG: cytochrome c oxidase subunit II [Cyanobacteria bacterium K_DeepCast_35m_m2_023]|nr:cytochrome c oxidase subunit II [Cyanobacteria bacterium K_DeepCast_35m_m2_023]